MATLTHVCGCSPIEIQTDLPGEISIIAEALKLRFTFNERGEVEGGKRFPPNKSSNRFRFLDDGYN